MKEDYLKKLETFNIDSLPDLDEIVLASLQFFSDFDLPRIDTETYKRPLVIGSVNAFRIGKIIFSDTDAIFADEGSYLGEISQIEGIDAVYIVSASGGKHATEIAQETSKLDVPLFLITNNLEAPAAEYIDEGNILIFPHIREPYTYNTSTYMSMLLSCNGNHNPSSILSFIEEEISTIIPQTLGDKNAFTLILPTKFDAHKGLFMTKFDELFGPEVNGRVFTIEQIKHAKTIVSSDKELFISFGVENKYYGSEENRLHIPLPNECGPVGIMAIGYYLIGHIQKQHPQYFKENIAAYSKIASDIFGHQIKPIVD